MLIEAWWRVLKFGWLFINHLDNTVTPRRLIEFYANEHNQRTPHSAFDGQTSDEMYFGRGATIPDALAEKERISGATLAQARIVRGLQAAERAPAQSRRAELPAPEVVQLRQVLMQAAVP